MAYIPVFPKSYICPFCLAFFVTEVIWEGGISWAPVIAGGRSKCSRLPESHLCHLWLYYCGNSYNNSNKILIYFSDETSVRVDLLLLWLHCVLTVKLHLVLWCSSKGQSWYGSHFLSTWQSRMITEEGGEEEEMHDVICVFTFILILHAVRLFLDSRSFIIFTSFTMKSPCCEFFNDAEGTADPWKLTHP